MEITKNIFTPEVCRSQSTGVNSSRSKRFQQDPEQDQEWIILNGTGYP